MIAYVFLYRNSKVAYCLIEFINHDMWFASIDEVFGVVWPFINNFRLAFYRPFKHSIFEMHVSAYFKNVDIRRVSDLNYDIV